MMLDMRIQMLVLLAAMIEPILQSEAQNDWFLTVVP